jgi:hypothetical protein
VPCAPPAQGEGALGILGKAFRNVNKAGWERERADASWQSLTQVLREIAPCIRHLEFRLRLNGRETRRVLFCSGAELAVERDLIPGRFQKGQVAVTSRVWLEENINGEAKHRSTRFGPFSCT